MEQRQKPAVEGKVGQFPSRVGSRAKSAISGRKEMGGSLVSRQDPATQGAAGVRALAPCMEQRRGCL